MRKKRRILLAAIAFAIVGGMGWLTYGNHAPPEPLYLGHTVGWWLRHPDVQPSGLPLMEADSNALPVLIKALETQDGPCQRAYLDVWLKMPVWLQKKLSQPVPASDVQAVAVCMIWNSKSGTEKSAIPALIRVLDSDDDANVRWYAAAALGKIGVGDERAVEALARAERDDARISGIASIELGNMKRDSAAGTGIK